MKKIGENLKIKNIIIHQLLKEAGNKEVNAKSATQVLNIGDRERLFMGKIDESYYKKSEIIHGIFSGDFPKFKELLLEYMEGKNSFYDFSIDVMEHYKETLEGTIAATGGYMILCEYTKLKKDLLLVLMINNKEGFVINETDLSLGNIRNLELHKVDIACTINLTDWKAIENEDLTTDRKTYLSFVKGLKDISLYFMKFIDVDNKNTSIESTNRLLKAIDEFAKKEGWDIDRKIQRKDAVCLYCLNRMNEKREILLSDISAIMDPDNPENFQNLATEDEFGVSSVISGNKAKLRQLKRIAYKDDNLRLEFDTNLFLNKTIIYDENKNKLTIKNIPDLLKQQIKKLND